MGQSFTLLPPKTHTTDLQMGQSPLPCFHPRLTPQTYKWVRVLYLASTQDSHHRPTNGSESFTLLSPKTHTTDLQMGQSPLPCFHPRLTPQTYKWVRVLYLAFTQDSHQRPTNGSESFTLLPPKTHTTDLQMGQSPLPCFHPRLTPQTYKWVRVLYLAFTQDSHHRPTNGSESFTLLPPKTHTRDLQMGTLVATPARHLVLLGKW